MHRHLLRVIGLLACGSPLLADVLVVDPSGAGDFTDPHWAIVAASEGDTVLIRPGEYTGFLLADKSLSIVAETPGSVTLRGGFAIASIPPGKRVVLSGLALLGDSTFGIADGLRVINCLGDVRIEGCVIESDVSDLLAISATGYHAATVTSCGAVSFVGCTLRGGKATFKEQGCGGTPGWEAGGSGLQANASRVSVHDCTITGGEGGPGFVCSVAGPGGAGVRAFGGSVYVAGSQLAGGMGGKSALACACGGDGGPALALENAQADVLDVALIPGLPNPASATGVPGPTTQLVGLSTLDQLDGTAPALGVLPGVTRMTQLAVAVQGDPGDLAVLAASIDTGWLDVPALHGPVLIGFPLLLAGLPLGAIGAGGEATVLLSVPALPPGVEVATFFMQAVAVDALGAIRLTGPRTVQVFQAGLLP